MSAASSSLVCGVATKIGGFFPQHATNKLMTAPVHHRAKGRMSTLTCRAAVECDVSQLKTGMVHFGVGGFHRSHQQVFMDELMRAHFDETKHWAYTGVGVLPGDAHMRDYLIKNNFSYPVVSREGPDEEHMAIDVQNVITLRDMMLAYEDPKAAVMLLADPGMRIVTITITEYGYRVPLTDGDRTMIAAALNGDLDTLPEECKQCTAFGIIISGLAARFHAGTRPFTVLSCDNLPHNGDVAKARVMEFTEHCDVTSAFGECVPDFLNWVTDEVKFPSTMVDRITPATSPDDIAHLKKHGVEDDWPVMCEPYKHWVVQDDFVDGARPAFEKVGAQMVSDVRPHELMKVRLLNVTHSALAYTGAMAGLECVHEAVCHEVLRPFLDHLMRDEIAPTLRADQSLVDAGLVSELDAYGALILSRFENVAVKDMINRIAMDGSEKFRVQGRPVVMEGRALGMQMKGFALYIASWAHFLKREVEAGAKVKDAGADLITPAWAPGGGGVDAFLDVVQVFGELSADAEWRGFVKEQFAAIESEGLTGAVQSLMAAEASVAA